MARLTSALVLHFALVICTGVVAKVHAPVIQRRAASMRATELQHLTSVPVLSVIPPAGTPAVVGRVLVPRRLVVTTRDDHSDCVAGRI